MIYIFYLPSLFIAHLFLKTEKFISQISAEVESDLAEGKT